MQIEISDAVWLDERQELSLDELAELSGLSQAELRELVEYEALAPAGVATEQQRFTAECLAIARTASRLRHDFDLDADALALVLRLLDRIRYLETELLSVRARLPRRHR